LPMRGLFSDLCAYCNSFLRILQEFFAHAGAVFPPLRMLQ